MMMPLRLFLVFSLVLLQCIAPLVHAHINQQTLNQGLHIPGLESYARTSEHTLINNTSCHVNYHCTDDDGVIVGIHTGVSREITLPIQRLYKLIADSDNDAYLPTLSIMVKPILLLLIGCFVIPIIVLFHSFQTFVHYPRAPPLA